MLMSVETPRILFSPILAAQASARESARDVMFRQLDTPRAITWLECECLKHDFHGKENDSYRRGYCQRPTAGISH